ncbi:SGNH/GDSL hydrolase family protein [Mycoplasma phocimorsus]|uniref:SGNH/GDSL hydrolase family protein n=1 Tax=Mycoplasma phocimorsus TaxID=3045839 RepID=UPI0024BF13E5|nr:SGNH/GDSL hydrolase family protein [Mycoplasma phocimorsus]MDJ1649165.1 GDSL-type esterase/lipase family protein [Mycoplasma phocimorsus]
MKKKQLFWILVGTITAATALIVGTVYLSNKFNKEKVIESEDPNIRLKNDKNNNGKAFDFNAKENSNNDEIKNNVGIFNESNPVKYIALGDSITDGFTSEINNLIQGKLESGNISGYGYPSFLADLIQKVNPKLLSSFENIAISGSTFKDWNNNLSQEEYASKIKDANLITITLGANDYIKSMLTYFYNEIDLSAFFKIKGKDLKNYLLDLVVRIFDKIDITIRQEVTAFLEKITLINSNAKILFISYPLALIRLADVINTYLSILFNSEEQLTIIHDFLNIVNRTMNEVIEKYSQNINPNIKIVNAFDNKYWIKNADKVGRIAFSIHPSIKGYKKLAQDIFIAISTSKNKKDLEENKIFLDDDYYKKFIQNDKLIEFNINDLEVLKRAFGNDGAKWIFDKSEIESKVFDLIKDYSVADEYYKKIDLLFRYYIEQSKKGEPYYVPSVPILIKSFKDNILDVFDKEGKIYAYLSKDNFKVVFDLLTKFVDNNVIRDMLSEFQKILEEKDDKGNYKYKNITPEIFKDIVSKTILNEQLWMNFLRNMLDSEIIGGGTLKEILFKVLDYAFKDNDSKLLSKFLTQIFNLVPLLQNTSAESIQKISNFIKRDSIIFNLVKDSITYFEEWILHAFKNPSFKTFRDVLNFLIFKTKQTIITDPKLKQNVKHILKVGIKLINQNTSLISNIALSQISSLTGEDYSTGAESQNISVVIQKIINSNLLNAFYGRNIDYLIEQALEKILNQGFDALDINFIKKIIEDNNFTQINFLLSTILPEVNKSLYESINDKNWDDNLYVKMINTIFEKTKDNSKLFEILRELPNDKSSSIDISISDIFQGDYYISNIKDLYKSLIIPFARNIAKNSQGDLSQIKIQTNKDLHALNRITALFAYLIRVKADSAAFWSDWNPLSISTKMFIALKEAYYDSLQPFQEKVNILNVSSDLAEITFGKDWQDQSYDGLSFLGIFPKRKYHRDNLIAYINYFDKKDIHNKNDKNMPQTNFDNILYLLKNGYLKQSN